MGPKTKKPRSMAGLENRNKNPAQWPGFEGVSLRSQQYTLLYKHPYSVRKTPFSKLIISQKRDSSTQTWHFDTVKLF